MATEILPRWVKSKETLEELYKEFIEILSEPTTFTYEEVLEFLKKRIFEPNNVKYEDYGDYLKVINPENGRTYIFLYAKPGYVNYKNLESVYEIKSYAIQKAIENFKKDGIKDIDELEKYEIYAITMNAILNLYYDITTYSWVDLCLENNYGECVLDKYSFMRFLARLTNSGIIKEKAII
jgi:hypothetical protein